ncbi:TonB-dependent receptor domain-containing protein [Paracidobacterium acidisoli]|uniref:TonB-dependent receptor n=1 Tax=Paracidobacterium acidisoli TaxID=2303751 RepID=A0A372III7_9BACT|nr:TonB-dependent receptor [Paracidobacterium acidisoli]MBT9333369.1 carboxypeptidase regulatory-like domain-containing protein [Paracidobacterium acidisoli]
MTGFRSALPFALFVAMLAVFSTISVSGQNITGSIIGQITDSSGAVVAGATVTATDLATSVARATQCNASGQFQLLSMPTGQYRIEVRSSGFKTYTRTPVEVLVDQATRIDVALEVGNTSQQVVVTAQAPLLQVENASLGQVVQGKAVTDMPLNGRNVLSLVALVPGVVPQGGTSTNLTGQNVFAAGNYQIGGGTANQSSTLVDGGPVNVLYGNATMLVPDQDVVQEFRVQTNNNTAEFGMYTGGVINIATKSGSNAFHGTTYEYVRNTIFDATDFFSKRGSNGKQQFHQNQFGGNIGGPIWRNKAFFFFDYQGYRQIYDQPFNANTPTPAELQGDFSAITTKIYDPLTTCGYNGNPACTAAQLSGTAPLRTQFSYNGVPNVIPPDRESAVAKNLIAYPEFGKETSPGTPGTALNNFNKFAPTGGNNDQYTIRGDQQISSKQRTFERYTLWKSKNVAPDPYGNGLVTSSPIAPEAFTTRQIVFGDTYVVNPTTIADLRISWMRWNYNRIPGGIGYNLANAGFPSYFSALTQYNGFADSTSVPRLVFNNPTYSIGGTGLYYSINNNYGIAPTFTKVLGQHTLKAGADLRRLDESYYENGYPGGQWTFDNVFTSGNPSSPGSTGNPVASFFLGYVATGIVPVSPFTYTTLDYQGYYVTDTWQASSKLTVTAGVRYEIPGVYVERHNRTDAFNPTETNPIVGVPGAFDLVATSQHPERGMRSEHFTNFQPRLGIAYRLNEKTVLRAGWGTFMIPSDLQFPESPYQAAINSINNNMVTTVNGNETPYNAFDNPFPSGLLNAPGRNPNFQQTLLGGSASATLADEPNGLTYQWNVTAQRQLPYGIALEAAYAGLHGAHLPVSIAINQLPDKYLAQAASDPDCVGPSANLRTSCFLTKQVTNPFYGKILQGTLQQPTVQQNQLLLPFPQYGNITNTGHYVGVSNYDALQMKLEKRFNSGGVLLGSYTFSKVLTNAETLTSWLDGSPGGATFQDTNNLNGEYALSTFDSRQRLVVSYVYSLPFGKGQRLFAHANGVVNGVIGGWGVNGVTTFQDGFPLGFTATPNTTTTYALAGGLRPNVTQGCDKSESGSMFDRLGGALSKSTYFNTTCFTHPGVFTYGNESRSDNELRTPGIANYDFALFKDTPITEHTSFEFRVESFNLFNRTQFAPPVQVLGNSQFGQITTQQNLPRLLQLAGRLSF